MRCTQKTTLRSSDRIKKDGTSNSTHLQKLRNLIRKLFKDGRDKYGNRIVDTPNSKLCHQCCRIAEGKKTNCHQCKSEKVRSQLTPLRLSSAKGQLCGDCLFVRYGENLDELDENWICPCCREICNCDICRLEKVFRLVYQASLDWHRDCILLGI